MASRNAFDLLGDGDSDNESPKTAAPAQQKKSGAKDLPTKPIKDTPKTGLHGNTRQDKPRDTFIKERTENKPANSKRRERESVSGGKSGQSSTRPQRRNKDAPNANEEAIKDKNIGSARNRAKSTEGGEARRPPRGVGKHDRQNPNAPRSTQKATEQAWGTEENAQEDQYAIAAQDAAAEKNQEKKEGDVEEEKEEESNEKTLQEYLAEKAQAALNLVKPAVRKAEEDGKYKNTAAIQRRDLEAEDTYFSTLKKEAGKLLGAKDTKKEAASKKKGEKLVLDEYKFADNKPAERSSRGRGDGRGRGRGAGGRGGAPTRGSYRGGRGGNNGERSDRKTPVAAFNADNFPSL